ncbi:uncharacterized protein EV420DRAFT_1636819 [Desarmillaria tabescens]|uniref:Uncharacterized protein n=1 Tax=Armillaria tabescens TaxID=1929756 RepID=A0AA39NIG5_ARMTA|nr:uncharacterized protein EV420DRAFT_1636819 [Desarmillaria tabescens]KAK0466232.1 hypothetical protein EV420DRAFT_1636819 [Desarmillaria tabescens]
MKLTFVLTFAAAAFAIVGAASLEGSTNAARMARGLPPNPPAFMSEARCTSPRIANIPSVRGVVLYLLLKSSRLPSSSTIDIFTLPYLPIIVFAMTAHFPFFLLVP